jgi:hypothetical protein
MSKVIIPIDEVIQMIKIKDPIIEIKGELIDNICTLDNKYIKNIEVLLYLNINTLKNILKTLNNINYTNIIDHSHIILSEDIIYY